MELKMKPTNEALHDETHAARIAADPLYEIIFFFIKIEIA